MDNMNLGDIYIRVRERLGKDQFGGYVTPLNFNQLLPWVNIFKLNDLIKVFEEKSEISRDLFPFIKTVGSPDYPPITLDSYGYGEYPEDYYYTARSSYSQLLNNCGGYAENIRMVEFLNQQDFGYRVSTELMKPTLEQPIAVDENDRFLVRPQGIPSVGFTYIRKPDTPVFDYDIVNGKAVYLPPGTFHTNSSVLPAGTPSQSVEFEFLEAVYEDLMNIIVKEYAIKIRSEFNYQTSNTDQGA
jgi:hypothetical protein